MRPEVVEVARQARAWLRARRDEGRGRCPVPAASLVVARPPPPPAVAARPPPGIAGPPASGDAAAEALEGLRAKLSDCRACKLWRGRTNVVVGSGPAGARLMLVGEGPGRDEDLQGEPFVGESGRLLDRMLQAMGLSRRAVFIANIIKCRPPRNRDPEADEVAACAPFVAEQIELVGPRVVVALGRFAAQTLLADPQPIGRMRGRWQSVPGGGPRVMPTFHPAYLLRNPAAKRLVWQDLKQVMQALS